MSDRRMHDWQSLVDGLVDSMNTWAGTRLWFLR